MKLKEIIRNPLVSSIVLTSLFVVSFAVGPYHSPTALTVLFAGIATMLLWVNLTGIINLASAFAAETRQLNMLVEKINEARDSEALAKISSRATEKMASPAVSLDAKVFYTQVHEHLRVHPHTNLDALEKHFITLGQYNLQLQARPLLHRQLELVPELLHGQLLLPMKSPSMKEMKLLKLIVHPPCARVFRFLVAPLNIFSFLVNTLLPIA